MAEPRYAVGQRLRSANNSALSGPVIAVRHNDYMSQYVPDEWFYMVRWDGIGKTEESGESVLSPDQGWQNVENPSNRAAARTWSPGYDAQAEIAAAEKTFATTYPTAIKRTESAVARSQAADREPESVAASNPVAWGALGFQAQIQATPEMTPTERALVAAIQPAPPTDDLENMEIAEDALYYDENDESEDDAYDEEPGYGDRRL